MQTAHPPTPTAPAPSSALLNIIPKPLSVSAGGGNFTLPSTADIYVEPESAAITAVGQYLASKLNPSTGYGLQVLSTTGAPADGNIYLTTAGASPSLGDEGYMLTVTPGLVALQAYQPEGLFRGIQTIRQLFPPAIESSTVQAGPWTIPTGTVQDSPRYTWRGAMLDVARHFFSVADVKRYIDEIAYYKLNRFHIHLSDDQGWRIMIKSWPNLATHGGSTQVGGGPGGYYTQAEYSDIVAYAQARYIMVVPEIDMPGHTNAALAAHAELNCNDAAPALYTGTDVGFSSLCISNAMTYVFVNDVVHELSAITPGSYIHVGGDEARSTPLEEYKDFQTKVQNIVRSHRKQMVGWEEIAQTTLPAGSIVQQWNTSDRFAQLAVAQGARFVMSPAHKTYLDMKYYAETELGLTWAALINTQTAYEWDPAALINDIPSSAVIGVEAPLWTETLVNLADIEYMAFPRLAGCAEIGWSPAAGRDWSEYRVRLASHGPRLSAMGVNFYRDPIVPWQQVE